MSTQILDLLIVERDKMNAAIAALQGQETVAVLQPSMEKKRSVMSPEGRANIVAALKRRAAERKAAKLEAEKAAKREEHSKRMKAAWAKRRLNQKRAAKK
jgi:acetyl-CoA carboxylase carboxyltransferase component